MQPTCSGMQVRTTTDARKIFEAVYLKFLPLMPRRLDTDERRNITSGHVFVWEERPSNSAHGGSSGIERWTDSITWGPSRVKEEFLYYREKVRVDAPIHIGDPRATTGIFRLSFPGSAPRNLVKQTYSVYVRFPQNYKKWHLTAYFVEDIVQDLHTVDNHPAYPFLANITFPPDKYISARGPRQPAVLSPLPVNFLETIPAGSSTPHDEDSVQQSRIVPSSPVPWRLPPLKYLERASPQLRQRHPVDERAILSFEIERVFRI